MQQTHSSALLLVAKLRDDEAGMISGDSILVAAIAILATLATASVLHSEDAIAMPHPTTRSDVASSVPQNAAWQDRFRQPQQERHQQRRQQTHQQPQAFQRQVKQSGVQHSPVAPTRNPSAVYVPRSRFPMRGVPILIQYMGRRSSTHSGSLTRHRDFSPQHNVRPKQTGISVNYHTGVPRMRVSEWRPQSTGMTMTEAHRAKFSD